MVDNARFLLSTEIPPSESSPTNKRRLESGWVSTTDINTNIKMTLQISQQLVYP